MTEVLMNGRILLVRSNGQPRVAAEINRRLGLETITPSAGFASGSKGHLWEQVALPMQLRGRPLWSPSTSAPIAYGNQVVTVHDIGFVDAPQFFTRRFAQIYDFIVTRATRVARHLVTVSEFSRQRLIAHYRVPEDRVTAVHLGVSDAFSIRPATEVAAITAAHGLTGRPYLVAFSGSDARKNTQGVLEAWRQLREQRRGAKLVLFGRISNASVFGSNELALDDADIVRVGGVSDEELAALFTGSQGLVFPSFYEGFGLPVIEAVASGAPVVTSTVTSLPEVAPAGGRLIDPTRVGELADAMADLIAAPRSDIDRARAAAEMTARFSWDRTADRYREIFAKTFG